MAQAEALIAQFAPGRRTRPQAAFAVLDPTGATLLGCLTLQFQTPFMEPADDEAEVAYWVCREERGRGVATAALRVLADWALSTDADSRETAAAGGGADALPADDVGAGPHLRRLWLEIDPGHPASMRVAEKAGFGCAGTLPRAVGGAAATADHCLIYERLASPD